MRLLSLFAFVLAFIFLAGCSEEKSSQTVLATEQEALNHFLEKENASTAVGVIYTPDKQEIYLIREGNEQYSVYGLIQTNDQYAVEKLAATISLHHALAGGFEFVTPAGKTATIFLAKHLAGLAASEKDKYTFFPILNKSVHVSLSEGHVLADDSEQAVNVIQSTETLRMD